MKDSKVIALSGLSSAFALIFIIIGGYFPTFDISCLFMASLMIMIPLAKDTLKGAILCYISVFLLSFIFTFGHFEISNDVIPLILHTKSSKLGLFNFKDKELLFEQFNLLSFVQFVTSSEVSLLTKHLKSTRLEQFETFNDVRSLK